MYISGVLRSLSLICTALVLSTSCSKIFEQDISNDVVILIAPSDSITLPSSNVSFQWEKLNDAIRYSFEVASPGFDVPHVLILDTLITATALSIEFGAGNYQWRVRGENGSSSTQYSTRNITIDLSTDLSSQSPSLISPSEGLMVSSNSLVFMWNSMYSADQYRFSIRTPDWAGALYGSEITTSNDSISIASIADGQYTWGVRGENQFTVSNYSTRSVWIDTQIPNTPSSIFPSQNASLGDSSITFLWDRLPDTGTPLIDSVYIYSDTLMTTLVTSAESGSESHTDSLGVGTFFWRVITYDGAANASIASELRKLMIN